MDAKKHEAMDEEENKMETGNFTGMLLRELEEAGASAWEAGEAGQGQRLLGAAMPDGSQFLVKIGRRDTEEEAFLQEMDETDSRIPGIFEKFSNSWEYNHVLMQNEIDIGWLEEKLDIKDMRKLESYILSYGSRNDLLVFRLGFRYAWSLFHESAGK